MRELNEEERESLVEDGLGLEVDDYAYLDGEDGFAVRQGQKVGWEVAGSLFAYEMDSEGAAQAKFREIVLTHSSALNA
jgi:hypothetical protein